MIYIKDVFKIPVDIFKFTRKEQALELMVTHHQEIQYELKKWATWSKTSKNNKNLREQDTSENTLQPTVYLALAYATQVHLWNWETRLSF